MAEEEIQSVSMSNTKKEILEAYGELIEKFKKRKEESLDAEERIQEIETQKVVAAAEELSADEVVQNIARLKSEVSGMLGRISDRLEEEVARFQSVQKAIGVKERELEDIYGIGKEAGSLAALIEAQNKKKTEFEAEMAERKSRLEEEIRRTRESWEKEKDRRAEERVDSETEEARRRQREKEEWEYDFEREKRLARDQFEEEKSKIERDLQRSREELKSREEQVAARESELESLRAQVEILQKEKQDAAAQAAQEADKQARAEAKVREELLVKEFNGERNVLQARIESLEKTIAEQTQQIARLSQIQDKAYQQVQDIAIKAVEGASNVKHLAASITESARRKPQPEE